MQWSQNKIAFFFLLLPVLLGGVSCSKRAPAVNRSIDVTQMVREGKYEEAISQIKRTLAEYPNHPDLLFNLASIQRLQGNIDMAKRTLSKALSVKPDDDTMNFLMVELEIESGNIQNAWDQFHALHQSFRRQARSQHTLGIIHAMLGNWKNAEGCFRASIGLGNSSSSVKASLAYAVCKQGRIEEGKAYLLDAETSSEMSSDAQIQIAECHLLLGQADRAREIARSLINNNTNDARIWSLLGRAEMILLNFSESESAFARAITSPNATPWTQVQYAEMLFAAHREDEALTQAIDAETKIEQSQIPVRNPSLYNLLATLYAKNNQMLLAQRFLSRSYQINPNQPRIAELLQKINAVQQAVMPAETIRDTTSTTP